MKKGIKSYMAFTSGAYRLILFVLVPIAVIGLNVALAVYVHQGSLTRAVETDDILGAVDIMMLVAASLMMFAEVMLDNLAFGGIAVKRSQSLDYMKASPWGRQLMRRALRTDMVRCLFESVIVITLSRAAWSVVGEATITWRLQDIVRILAVVACQYFVTVTVLIVTRHYDIWGVNMLAVYLGFLVLLAFIAMSWMNSFAMLAVMTALSVAVSVFSQWKIMRRVEAGFYDK